MHPGVSKYFTSSVHWLKKHFTFCPCQAGRIHLPSEKAWLQVERFGYLPLATHRQGTMPQCPQRQPCLKLLKFAFFSCKDMSCCERDGDCPVNSQLHLAPDVLFVLSCFAALYKFLVLAKHMLSVGSQPRTLQMAVGGKLFLLFHKWQLLHAALPFSHLSSFCTAILLSNWECHIRSESYRVMQNLAR